jgi:hypothetical protein
VLFYGILLGYAATALAIEGFRIDRAVVLSTVPLVIIADGLPSVSGLGTRETALVLLLKPPEPEVLVAVSLVWSSGMLVGRLLIGIFHLWRPGAPGHWSAPTHAGPTRPSHHPQTLL